MYRNARRSVERALMSELYLEVLRQWEKKDKANICKRGYFEILKKDLDTCIGSDPKLFKSLQSLADKTYQYYVDNKFDVRKSRLVTTLLASKVSDEKLVDLPGGIIQIILDTNATVIDADENPTEEFSQEDLYKLYRSCEKHADKLKQILHDREHFKQDVKNVV